NVERTSEFQSRGANRRRGVKIRRLEELQRTAGHARRAGVVDATAAERLCAVADLGQRAATAEPAGKISAAIRRAHRDRKTAVVQVARAAEPVDRFAAPVLLPGRPRADGYT